MMCNLRFLRFYDYFNTDGSKLLLPDGLEYLPEELRYLEWKYYPLESLPPKFCLKNLVELRISRSQLKQLWNGDVSLANLKVIDLSDSPHLIRLPELSGALNLEVLILHGCTSLVEISSFLQYLSKLTEIRLQDCINLYSLPSFLLLEHLEELSLDGCSKLEKCPEIPCNVVILSLDGTAIEELPSSVEHCSQLIKLSLRKCRRLVSLPREICSLKFLEFLNMKGCSNLKALPENLGDLESLQVLDMSENKIEVLPSSINQLTNLQTLDCSRCDGLTMLPPLTGLSSLTRLYLSDCGIIEIPESIKELSNLEALTLTNCKRLRCLPELPRLLRLEASNCFSLKSVSTSILSSPECQSAHQLYYILELAFLNCENLQSKVIVDNVFMKGHMEKKMAVSLSVPAVEAPERMWFKNKNGSTILDIKLDDKKIIGFSFCSVIDSQFFDVQLPEDFIDIIDFQPVYDIMCIAEFKDKSGRSFCSNFYFTEYEPLFMMPIFAQHVFLWYEENPYSKEHLTYASFKFYMPTYYGYTLEEEYEKMIDKAIVKCGIHPMYEDDCVGRDRKRRRNDDQNESDQDLPLEKQEKMDLNLSLSLCST